MCFQTIEIPTFAGNFASPCFALIPVTPKDADVITDSDREGIHRIDVIDVLSLGPFQLNVQSASETVV